MHACRPQPCLAPGLAGLGLLGTQRCCSGQGWDGEARCVRPQLAWRQIWLAQRKRRTPTSAHARPQSAAAAATRRGPAVPQPHRRCALDAGDGHPTREIRASCFACALLSAPLCLGCQAWRDDCKQAMDLPHVWPQYAPRTPKQQNEQNQQLRGAAQTCTLLDSEPTCTPCTSPRVSRRAVPSHRPCFASAAAVSPIQGPQRPSGPPRCRQHVHTHATALR